MEADIMEKRTKLRKNKLGKIYVLGIALICGFLLISADDCESMYLAEEQYARELAMREQQEKAARAEKEQLAASQATSGTQQGTKETQGSQAATGGSSASSGSQTASGGSSTSSGTQTGNQTSSGGSATASGTQTGTSGSSTSSGTQTGNQPSSGGSATASGTQTGSGGSSASGTQTASSGSTGANYVTSISGKNWKLVELRFTDRTVVLNRSELTTNEADIFTMTVDSDRISGKGAPNRYFTAYQAGANNALTIQPIASTMMASIVSDPQRIRESEYFQYLGKVKSWRINQNKLELTSADAANKAVTMVFSN